MKNEKKDAGNLTVSVIIPVYKPDDKFPKLLRMLEKQTCSFERLIIMNTEKQYWKKEWEELVSKMEVHLPLSIMERINGVMFLHLIRMFLSTSGNCNSQKKDSGQHEKKPFLPFFHNRCAPVFFFFNSQRLRKQKFPESCIRNSQNVSDFRGYNCLYREGMYVSKFIITRDFCKSVLRLPLSLHAWYSADFRCPLRQMPFYQSL